MSKKKKCIPGINKHVIDPVTKEGIGFKDITKGSSDCYCEIVIFDKRFKRKKKLPFKKCVFIYSEITQCVPMNYYKFVRAHRGMNPNSPGNKNMFDDDMKGYLIYRGDNYVHWVTESYYKEYFREVDKCEEEILKEEVYPCELMSEWPE